jgi:hypothetical protein
MGVSQGGPITFTPVVTKALWNWNTSVSGQPPVLNTFSSGANTKTGLQPSDLQQYVLVPFQIYGNPPIPLSPALITNWIRDAEDEIENDTNIKLCQTWIAAPPAKNIAAASTLGIKSQGNYQQLGIDYDYSEAGYDFFFSRARDEGWIYQKMRWRPVQGVEYVDPTGIIDPSNNTGIKNVAFVYPLLNEYFRMPNSWIVEDQRAGLVRFVPATAVQMLPLFAMQLAFMGFAENVPAGIWFQYTAGLTAADYQTDFSFMKQLVLARAGVTALKAMQLSVNYGVLETTLQADGLMQRMKFDPKGAFAGQIMALEEEVKRLTRRAKSMVGGINLGIL